MMSRAGNVGTGTTTYLGAVYAYGRLLRYPVGAGRYGWHLLLMLLAPLLAPLLYLGFLFEDIGRWLLLNVGGD